MKNLRLLSFLLTLFVGGMTSVFAQQELTVCDGTTTNQYVPVYGYYADMSGKSEFIITADKLTEMDGASVSKMTFYLSTPASEAWGATYRVFLKEVSATSLSGLIGDESATEVYSGTLDATGNTMAIDFSTDYSYSGGNLLVGIYMTAKGSNCPRAHFYGESISRGSYQSSGNVGLQSFVPKTTFVYQPSATPRLVVSPTVLDFGKLLTESTTAELEKTITIANKGGADLEGISVSYDGDAAFSVSALPATSIAQGGEPIVLTVTANTETAGSHTGTITVSAPGQTDAVVTLNSIVFSSDYYYEEFAAGEKPAGMVNSGWTFAAEDGGYAKATNQTATLTTPKLTVADGQTMMVAAMRNTSSTFNTTALKVYKKATREAEPELVADLGSQVVEGDWTPIAISGLSAGDYYLVFEGTYVNIDYLYGFTKTAVAHDLAVTAQTLPAAGEVNSPLTAQLKVVNYGNTEAADSYKAELFINNAVVATAEAVEIATDGTATYNFSYMPHAAGADLPVVIRLTANADNVVLAQSTEGTLTIAEEVAKSEEIIGTPTSATGYKAPVYAYGKYSWSDVVYYSRKINVESGAQISKITFKGNNTTERKASSIKVWIENSDANGASTSWTDPTDEPTLTLTDYVFPAGTDSDMLVLDLGSTPFTYTGGNLRIRMKTVMESASGNVNFFVDDLSGDARFDYESSDRTSTSLYAATAPVAWLSLVSEPIVLKGRVADQTSGAAIADAHIVVKSGDVEYYATSDAEGNYTTEVKKNLGSYTVSTDVEGYFPYSETKTLVPGENQLDILLRQAKDLYIVSSTLPATATVNTLYTATVDVQNVNAAAFAADRYTVKLYVDGEVVAEAASKDIAAGATEQFTLSYMPHATGTAATYVEIAWDAATAKTETVSVAVAEEVAGGDLQIGSVTTTTNQTAPANTFYYNSLSTMVYERSLMTDLPAGASLTRLQFKGNTEGSNVINTTVQVWLANTTDDETVASFDTDNMTLVYDGAVSIRQSAKVKYDLTLDEPFRYAGDNLRVVVRTASVGKSYGQTYFNVDQNHTAYMKSADDADEMLASDAAAKSLPVLYVQYTNARQLTGTVTDSESGEGIAGVTVTATAGDVTYTAETDSEGSYQMTVVQFDKTYTVTLSGAADYNDAAPQTADFAAGDVVLDFVLVKTATAIEGLPVNGQHAEGVYDLSGRKMNADGRLPKGVYVKNGRKFVVK